MDDPWGSPWADESPNTLPTIGAVASQTPVSPGRPSPLGRARKSPWETNDSPEGWTALANIDNAGVYGPTVLSDLAIEKWDSLADDDAVPQKESKDDRKLPWFTRAPQSLSAGIESLRRPKATDGQLSPDPWATEAVRLKALPVESPLSPSAQLKSIPPSIQVTAAIQTDADMGAARNGVLKSPVSRKDEPAIRIFENRLTGKATAPSDADVCAVSIENGVLKELPAPRSTHEGQASSRPSSSPSDESHPSGLTTESPRTSFGDEPTHPKFEREGSSNVKELVGLYNGLAVEGASSTTLKRQDDTTSNEDIVSMKASKPEDDFGDFEEGVSSSSGRDPLAKDMPMNDSAEALALVEPSGTIQDVFNDSTKNGKTFEDQGPIQFSIDISLLDSIFSVENPGSNGTGSLAIMASGIDDITDSFSTIEQRKTWYRISRYGTTKKHNTGDENYVRVDWPHSEIRTDTLRIVARWMEEKRLGGAVILGGNRLGSLFGWDHGNKAPKFPGSSLVNEVESKRRANIPRRASTHDPNDATLAGNNTRRISLEPISVSKKSTRDSPVAVSPQFSWSSPQPAGMNFDDRASSLLGSKSVTAPDPHLSKLSTAQKPKPPKALRTARETGATLLVPASFGQHQALGLQTVPMQRVAAHGVPTTTLPLNAPIGDDEWGEMVSSPANSATPHLPFSGPNHNLSESLVGKLNPMASLLSSSSGPGYGSSGSTDAGICSHGPTAVASFSTPEHSSSVPPTIPVADPWVSADLSIFDSPQQAAPPEPTTTTKVVPNRFQNLSPDPPQIASESLETPKPATLQKRPAQPRQRKSKEEVEQDRIVKSIVRDLPDLSYMLRH